MTMQIMDVVYFRQQKWDICNATPRLPFVPSDCSIEPLGFETANYRGYYCKYDIIDEKLQLIEATIGVENSVWQTAKEDRLPELFGVSPAFKYHMWRTFLFFSRREIDKNYLIYRTWHHIPFTGGLLLGRGLQVEIPFVFSYSEVWEVLFEEGRVVYCADRSEEVSHLWKFETELANKKRAIKASGFPESEKLLDEEQERFEERWNRLFSLRYKFS